MAGPSDSRKSLLNQALKIDPGFKPALWQSGRVRWDDQWLTLEQAARQADEDPTWAAYRKLRDEMIDSADGHRKRPREAYNLVVVDFDTYFVGDKRILVHDNQPLAETAAAVPGLNKQEAN